MAIANCRTLFYPLVTATLMNAIVGCSHNTLPTGHEVEASMATMVWLDDHVGILRDRDLNRLLSRMVHRLASSVQGAALETQSGSVNTEEYKNFPWQVYVVQSAEPNAFSSGAGTIILTKGMLAQTRTEAELASILCHEMAHQILGHTKDALGEVSEATAGPQFAFSLNDEIAADTLGLKILHVARYDISHATYALSIGYRPVNGLVAGVPEDWLAIRMAYLQQAIEAYGPVFPSTQTTREFTRVQHEVFGRVEES